MTPRSLILSGALSAACLGAGCSAPSSRAWSPNPPSRYLSEERLRAEAEWPPVTDWRPPPPAPEPQPAREVVLTVTPWVVPRRVAPRYTVCPPTRFQGSRFSWQHGRRHHDGFLLNVQGTRFGRVRHDDWGLQRVARPGSFTRVTGAGWTRPRGGRHGGVRHHHGR